MTKRVLHVGCGQKTLTSLPGIFQSGNWEEVRLDINPQVQPDIICSMTDMSVVPSGTYDAVWSAHNLEHLFEHEVVPTLKEFARVTKPGGLVIVAVPDLQTVAERIAQGRLDEPLYTSPAGPIGPIDVLYGLRPSLAAGDNFMAHKMGFTAESLGRYFCEAGLDNVRSQRRLGRLEIRTIGVRLDEGVAPTKTTPTLMPPMKPQKKKPALKEAG